MTILCLSNDVQTVLMVKFLPKLTLLLSFFCLGFSVSGQNANIQLRTFIDEPVTYSLLSRSIPVVTSVPAFGEVSVTPGGLLYQYEITYTPESGFEGNDELRFYSFPLELTSFSFSRMEISVVRAEIFANHDAVRTLSGQAVTIPVMANDSSSRDTFFLRSAPVTNAGTAEIVGNQIVFTPQADFVGLTDFNYVICTEDDICALGTVSINVLDSNFSTSSDTVAVFTKKNKSQLILVPDTYAPVLLPTNGSYDINGDIPTYAPDLNFVGIDFIDFAGPDGSIKTYRVEVLDMIDEQFSVQDVAYTLEGNPVQINVIANDLYGGFTGCITYGTPEFGSLETSPFTGRITYTPPTNWSGVDRFTYQSYEPGCAGTSETQTVYVIISDFAPAGESVSITTTSGASIPLTYETPTGTINWSVTVPPTLGSIELSSEGQLIYTPDAITGTDQLAITYCLSDGQGGCELTKTVDVTININDGAGAESGCDDDCVWPGDTNKDGAVDMADFLTVGLHTGSTGTPRLTAAPEMWCPQAAEDWEQVDENEVNRKHVDANGDQIISSLDTQVVMNNFGMASRLRPSPKNTAGFDVFLEGDIFAEPGDLIAIDIVVGTRYVGVEDVYGFIFPFSYDPGVLTGVNVAFNEQSWLSYDSPVISTQVNDTISGQLTSAYVRTNGLPASGHGHVGTMYVGVEDVYGFRFAPGQETSTTIGGGYAEAMDGGGHLSSVYVNPFELTIRSSNEVSEPSIESNIDQFLDEKLLAFPNPAGNNLTVHLNGQREFTSLTLTDLTGRRVITQNSLITNHRVIDLSQIPTGLYTLSITTEEGVINRKIEVIH